MSTKRFFAVFLLVAVVVAGLLSFYASSHPDGLTKVAEDKGFISQEKEHTLKDSPLSDYGVRGVGDERLSGGLAGVIGVGLTLAVGGGLFWVLRRRGAPAGRR
ncbi:PDGLE domain-containing protein [Actinomadura kijaniata]|uniref:PDGLE domain-containing protein n=1 Tax=Actinomadura kijaniata TaxID=46161 RepID=UPI00082B0938|nr:PDGLE domain-containing protein [Actinomadura kijaniata]